MSASSQALPVIHVQPRDHTTAETNLITLSVEATGTLPLSYQWFRSPSRDLEFSTPIAGATAREYTPPALSFTWGWWVRVTDAEGSVDSRMAVIDVVEALQFERVSSWPGHQEGAAVALKLWRNYAYVAGGSLQIFDVSDPQHPFLGGTYMGKGAPATLQILSGYAYLASDNFGLEILDVSDPLRPKPVADVPMFGAADVSVAGGYAYVACQFNGLQIVDVKNPGAPVLAGAYKDSGSPAAVKVVGNSAYITDGAFKILDVTIPSQPQLLGALEAVSGGLDLDGNFAFVSGPDRALMRIDISDPRRPERKATLQRNAPAASVQVDHGFAFVAGTTPAMLLVDVSDPLALKEVSALWTVNSSLAVQVDGMRAYLAANRDGLLVVDLTDRTTPQVIGRADTQRAIWGVGVDGARAYVTETLGDSRGGFRIMDVSDPAQIKPLGRYEAGRDAFIGQVQLPRVYVVASPNALQIVDVSNPEAPTEMGTYQVSGEASWVDVVGSYGYIAGGRSGLTIVDVADPNAPRKISAVSTGWWTTTVDVEGQFAYANDGVTGLNIIDISNPALPRVIGVYSNIVNSYSVAVRDKIAFVSTTDSSAQLLDVSDPTRPEPINMIPVPPVWPVADSKFLASGGNFGLQLFEFRHRKQLVRLGTVPGRTQGHAIQGGLVYVTTGDSLEIHRMAEGALSWTLRPQDQHVGPGEPALLRARAFGAGPLGYQWYSGSSGDTSNPLPLGNSEALALQPESPLTQYWLRASNPLGYLDSDTVRVTVSPKLSLLGRVSLPQPGVRAEVAAPKGARWVVERSPDLKIWQREESIQTVSIGTDWRAVILLPLGESNGVFYRLSWAP